MSFLKNSASVVFTMIKFSLFKILYKNRFSFRGIQRFSPDTSIDIEKGGIISLGKKVRAHTGTRIKAARGGIIKIGSNVSFNYGCLVIAHEKIEIGDGTMIGPNVLFYDHDHDFHRKNISDQVYKTSPISIGKNVWIGANCIILRGTEIGQGSVVAAGTVVLGGKYDKKSLIYIKKEIIEKRIE